MLSALALIPAALAFPEADCLSCRVGGDESRGLLVREVSARDLALRWEGAIAAFVTVVVILLLPWKTGLGPALNRLLLWIIPERRPPEDPPS